MPLWDDYIPEVFKIYNLVLMVQHVAAGQNNLKLKLTSE